MKYHVPVLVDKVLEYLITDTNGTYVDGTVGGGGHAEEILKLLTPKGRLIGIDRDEEAIAFSDGRLSAYQKQVDLIRGELKDIRGILEEEGVMQIDGIILDLGISSHQIDSPDRGFSYKVAGPLDMRMDSRAHKCALDIVNQYSEVELANLIFRYGEERLSRRIARHVVKRRSTEEIKDTGELTQIIERITPYKHRIKILSRVWQALRFEVNDELGQLVQCLLDVYKKLKSGGRIVILSYESLMDRMVKRYFRGAYPAYERDEVAHPPTGCEFNVLTKRVVRPSEDEVAKNPRARSARLRAAEKVQ